MGYIKTFLLVIDIKRKYDTVLYNHYILLCPFISILYHYIKYYIFRINEDLNTNKHKENGHLTYCY